MKPRSMAAILPAAKKPLDVQKLTLLGRELLVLLGENPDQPRIKDTPARWARMWAEFIDHNPGRIGTAFESHRTDQMVVISGMRVWSMCEHHLLPFWCEVAIGYIPQGKVLGLSKFGRIARACASSLQIQERLVQEIASMVTELANCPDVAVIATGEHLCMTMRGARMESRMTSSVMEGAFRAQPSARAEFLSIVRGPP